MGALLVVGTSSGVGKSVVVAGLCRWLAREGVRVAPFKAQNMSLNSYVTRAGEEIGRAQAAQARACYLEPEAVMGPVLLKPGSGGSAQLIVLGQAVGEHEAGQYRGDVQGGLLGVVTDAFAQLAARFDVVICEGAGSPAEVNLRGSDIVNMGFAQATGVPALLVGDIDLGGVFASFVGTLAVLDPPDQELIAGFVVNKFRGDQALLEPGLAMLGQLTGRPTLGVLPFVAGIGLDAEDSVDRALLLSGGPPLGEDVLRVHVVALPRMSNHTDVDALAIEPGVVVRFITGPAEVADADLVVLPGTRSTVADLAWLRGRGLDVAIARHVAAGRAVLGVCGGYQMLGTSIDDPVESGAGLTPGLGLLPVRTQLRAGQGAGPPTTGPGRRHRRGGLRDPSRGSDQRGRGTPGGRRGLPRRCRGRDGVARPLGERRLPAHLPLRGGPDLRATFRGRPGHVVRRRPGSATGPAGRPRRRQHRPGRGQEPAGRAATAPLPRSGSSSGPAPREPR